MNTHHDAGLFNLDSSARVLLRTLTQKLLPIIHPDNVNSSTDVKDRRSTHTSATPSTELTRKQETIVRESMNQYSTIAKQLDQLWTDIQPEYGLSLVVPQPPRSSGGGKVSSTGSSAQAPAQADIVASRLSTIPQLLSTMIPAEDEPHCLHRPDPNFAVAAALNSPPILIGDNSEQLHGKKRHVDETMLEGSQPEYKRFKSATGQNHGDVGNNDPSSHDPQSSADGAIIIDSEEQVTEVIDQHNEQVDRLLEEFSTRMERWKMQRARESSGSGGMNSGSSSKSKRSSIEKANNGAPE